MDVAGHRVRHYRNPVLREAAKVEGIVWDPPCLPADRLYPLFAAGDIGFVSRPGEITHGGLSLDEVIVPLVRVT